MLGIPPGDGTDLVCSSADLAGCKAEFKGVKAEEKCEKKGARLCTLEELEAGEGSMPGCDGALDDALFWTETPCDDESMWYVAKKDGSEAACLDKKSKDAKAAVLCCADLEPPIFTFFIGNGTEETPEGQMTPHFQFYADPMGQNAFFGPASMFRGLTYRIQRIVDDEAHPFDVATLLEDELTGLNIPHYSNVEEDRGIKFIGEWIQFTLPLDFPDNMHYHSTSKPEDMKFPFIIGTIFYVTGPNAPDAESSFNYFESCNAIDGCMPIRKFKSNAKKIPKLLKGEMYRFLPVDMEDTGFLEIITKPVKEAFPVIYGLPVAGQFAQFFVPPTYEGKVLCAAGNGRKLGKDTMRVVSSL